MIEVAAAIIEDEEKRLLIARRAADKAQGGMWEFPGGKLEPGETPEACLKRELREEMRIDIAPYARFGVNEHDYGTVRIRLIAYKATYLRGDIRLVDHDAYCWVARSELQHYAFAPADVPFVRRLSEESG
ncbi:8-oxo-dGTP diphosphatase MutT [Xylanibacillus composti]|uniref:8-oxo-dGTP diphosphatase n=1 Tax=Xylanibacillus composti TaxID=1572762 RepID=A0A8J4M4H1_9BACL|nr:8-oxo-dGTP diphosphatase MutT [Xylanibacillus composti]MDT9725725.1 8-oxo-dGTP diphosphatase MutT [Xylanibacillus composti]GIQ71135.1 NUDIX hydrolase [Xylanibacillus composti]